jgi:hypothetical protein
MIIFLLLNLSEIQPPKGLAMRFTKAKDEAMRPAVAGLRDQTSSKNAGSIETTASSAPKLAK